MTHATQFALAHGAALLFIWILLQQAGVPIPSAPLLIAVGSLASYGRLRLGPKFVVGSNVVSLLAGQTGLSAARFLIYDSIGSLAWSGSYIALGYLVHGQLHWTLAQTLRPLLVVRAAVFLARIWRGRSARAAMLVLATIFCALQPVSQHNAGIGMSARILHESRRFPEFTIHGLKPFLILT